MEHFFAPTISAVYVQVDNVTPLDSLRPRFKVVLVPHPVNNYVSSQLQVLSSPLPIIYLTSRRFCGGRTWAAGRLVCIFFIVRRRLRSLCACSGTLHVDAIIIYTRFLSFCYNVIRGYYRVVGNTPMTNNATGVYVVLIKSLSDSINLRFLLANIFPPLVYQRRR